MLVAYLLFITPVVLFVLAFLYETYISFKRLFNPKVGRSGYLSATWEVTHTLLVFAVVMLVMLFTSSIDQLASAIFTSTFIAAAALSVRAIAYTYIFYVRQKRVTSAVDWLFAVSHVVAAVFLVITVVKALWFIYSKHPEVNDQFYVAYFPGLALVLAICAWPIIELYTTKR